MLAVIWLRGLAGRRPGRIVASATGVAMAVALLASIGSFLSTSQATMTRRAIADVAVDWQIEAQAQADPAAVDATVAADPAVRVALPVDMATTTGLQAVTGGTTQTTGAGVVVGLADGYRAAFPGEVRTLAGAENGVLVAQQTAANLHVGPGDAVTIGRPGLDPATVTVDAVVDLPQADSLFQVVGAPPGTGPQAPPDNVVLLPAAAWHALFDPVATIRPELVHHQLHATVDHQLPSDPAAAFTEVTGRARNLEVRLAGTGLVGDNLGAALGSARSDALYAQILFLFLGVPGAVLAGLLTATVAGTGRDRRRREQALLRTRGASTRQLVHLGTLEALAIGVLGALAGLAGAALIGTAVFGSAGFGASVPTALAWGGVSALAGLAVAAATVAVPAWRDARGTTVGSSRQRVGHHGTPRWQRGGLDLVLLAASAVVFWLTARTGYKLVVAPEGVPTISVSYWAFAGPALLWAGASLLAWRLSDTLLRRGRSVLATTARPIAGPLAPTVAASLSRQRRLLSRAIVLVALTTAFAASTAIFNATYRQQADVDALLTNGADVTVTGSPGAPAGPDISRRLASIPGVRSVEPLQHRFAYVGNDLQDLYGVRPATIGAATKLQDAYFVGGTARQLMQRLAARPDNILVSQETVRDFQLRLGDPLTLRLQDGRTKQLVDVRFRYAGIAKEFPTAPRDSFLVANADYIAQQTGSSAVGAFLLDTGGANHAKVSAAARAVVGTTARVSDLSTSRRVVGSSLTAVDLGGLTKVELAFALVLAAGAAGLVLFLGIVERRRTFAIAAALGARPRQLAAFIWTEAVVVTAGGLGAGAGAGWVLSLMLVKVLNGVFDPPPAHLALPWAYLGAVTGIAVAAVAIAAGAATRASRPAITTIRDL